MLSLPFLLAAAALAFSPGPGVAYVLARTAAGGRREGLASCTGTALGGMLHVIAAALGLSLLLAQSAAAFQVLKLVGAAYLVYLGLRMILRQPHPEAAPSLDAQGPRRALTEGVVVEALNVKTALFFLAFLPQFAAPGAPLAPQLVVMGSVCVMFNTAADVIYVLLASRLIGATSAAAARRRWMPRLSGATLEGLGAFLALARRSH